MNKLTEQFFTEYSDIFTQADVATVINGSYFSRHGLIKRAMSAGEILNIRRGLYCLAPKYQKRPISIYNAAERIYGPSYVSLETALSYYNWIPEAVYACTCVSYQKTRQFETPLGIFSYKHVPQHILYLGVRRYEDKNKNVFLMASPAKALADYIYIHKLNRTNINKVAEDLRIEEEDFNNVNPQELSELIDNYSNHRVKQFLTEWLEVLKP